MMADLDHAMRKEDTNILDHQKGPGIVDTSKGTDASTQGEEFAKKTVADVMGQIVWLMTQSKEHRGLFLSDLEWAIMPPILSKQFKLFYHEGQPKGAVFWAMVDKETKERLDNTANPKLRLAEWRSGSIPYVVDAIAPTGNRDQLKIEFQRELETKIDAVVREGH